MSAPRHGDLVRAFRLLGTLGEGAQSAQQQLLGLLAVVARIVPSDFTTLSVCDLDAGRRFASAVPVEPPGGVDLSSFDRFLATHPLVRYHLQHLHARARRLSDCIGDAEFRRSDLYEAYYRPLGLDRVLLLPIAREPGRLSSIVLNRAGGDFTDHERALLDAIRVPVSALYRQAVASACAACAAGTLHCVASGDRVAAVTLDRNFGIVDASGRALAWLAEIARRAPPQAPGAALPAPIVSWLRAQIGETAAAQAGTRTASFVDEGTGARLVLHCVPRTCPSGCTLLIERAESTVHATAPAPRLTPRQVEILGWIAAGKTDDCIAELLGVSRRTVGKHLQNMYRRLGVENRTGAVMRALGR